MLSDLGPNSSTPNSHREDTTIVVNGASHLLTQTLNPQTLNFPQEDAMIVVDEAYADFAGCSADVLLAKYPNLMVCRTFSKWAGLAGLRYDSHFQDLGVTV